MTSRFETVLQNLAVADKSTSLFRPAQHGQVRRGHIGTFHHKDVASGEKAAQEGGLSRRIGTDVHTVAAHEETSVAWGHAEVDRAGFRHADGGTARLQRDFLEVVAAACRGFRRTGAAPGELRGEDDSRRESGQEKAVTVWKAGVGHGWTYLFFADLYRATLHAGACRSVPA
jgi:hypothetical protein